MAAVPLNVLHPSLTTARPSSVNATVGAFTPTGTLLAPPRSTRVSTVQVLPVRERSGSATRRSSRRSSVDPPVSTSVSPSRATVGPDRRKAESHSSCC